MKTHHTDESEDSQTRAGGNVITKGAGMAIETIATTAAIVSAAGGLKCALEMVRLWIEARKDRRIRIRKGDVEMKFQRTMSDKDIVAKMKHFERLSSKETDNEIKIIFP